MYYKPLISNNHLIRNLQRLSEADTIEAILILSKRLLDLRSTEYYLSLRVEDLPFSTRAHNALIKEKLITVRDIIECGYENTDHIRFIGIATTNEIRSLIEKIIERRFY